MNTETDNQEGITADESFNPSNMFDSESFINAQEESEELDLQEFDGVQVQENIAENSQENNQSNESNSDETNNDLDFNNDFVKITNFENSYIPNMFKSSNLSNDNFKFMKNKSFDVKNLKTKELLV